MFRRLPRRSRWLIDGVVLVASLIVPLLWGWDHDWSRVQIAVGAVGFVLVVALTILLEIATREDSMEGSVRFPPDQGPGRRGL